MAELKKVKIKIRVPLELASELDSASSRAREEASQLLNWRLQEISELQLRKLMEKDFCKWNGYIDLFNYRKRSRLEQAMIVYICHIRYLLVLFETSATKLLSYPKWVNQFLPKIWNTISGYYGVTRFKWDSLMDLIPLIQEEQDKYFSEPIDSRVFYLLKGNLK